MTKLTAEQVYALANASLEGGDGLARFNLIYEVRNGDLVTIDPRDLNTDGLKLIGVVGHVILEADYAVVDISGERTDAESLLESIKAFIRSLPDETAEELLDNPVITIERPATLAAIGLWRSRDGLIKYVPYHHPQVTPVRSFTILKKLASEIAAKVVAAADGPQAD